MSKQITYRQTLFYYDVPILFHGTDNIGCNYIFVLIENKNEKLKYICTPISLKRFKDFNKGFIDLRTIFSEPEIKEYYKCSIESLSDEILIDLFSSDALHSSMLPEPGFYLTEKIEDVDEVLGKAEEVRKPILYASLEPPEAVFETKIITDRLSGFLSVFQNMVKHAYKKACKKISPNILSLDIEDACKLQVIGFSEGSFTVQFEPLDAGDIFGSCGIEKSFEKIDEIVSVVENAEESLRILKENKGHLVGSYMRFLKFVIENKTSVEYKWASPMFKTIKKYRILQSDAEPLLDYLTQTEDISSERLTLVGKVISADSKTNRWKILNEEDQKEYSGRVKEGASVTLDGITIKTVRYEFVCEETIEEVLGTGKEQKAIQLLSYGQL